MAQTFTAGLNARSTAKTSSSGSARRSQSSSRRRLSTTRRHIDGDPADSVPGAHAIPFGALVVRLSGHVRRLLKGCWVGLLPTGRAGRALTVGAAIAADNTLTTGQRQVLLGLYDDFSATNRRSGKHGAVVGRGRGMESSASTRGRHRRPRIDADRDNPGALVGRRGGGPSDAERGPRPTRFVAGGRRRRVSRAGQGPPPTAHDPVAQLGRGTRAAADNPLAPGGGATWPPEALNEQHNTIRHTPVLRERKGAADTGFHGEQHQDESPDGPMQAFLAMRVDGLVLVATPVTDGSLLTRDVVDLMAGTPDEPR
jgi:hypothetical protein